MCQYHGAGNIRYPYLSAYASDSWRTDMAKLYGYRKDFGTLKIDDICRSTKTVSQIEAWLPIIHSSFHLGSLSIHSTDLILTHQYTKLLIAVDVRTGGLVVPYNWGVNYYQRRDMVGPTPTTNRRAYTPFVFHESAASLLFLKLILFQCISYSYVPRKSNRLWRPNIYNRIFQIGYDDWCYFSVYLGFSGFPYCLISSRFPCLEIYILKICK